MNYAFPEYIKKVAQGIVGQMGVPRIGLVQSYDPNTYTARVTIQPEGNLSGWLPIISPWVGPNWGFVCPLVIGQQVLTIPDTGDHENGIIVGAIFNDEDTAPNIPAGELMLKHQSGAFLRFHNNGQIEVNAAAGILSTGPWTHTGDMMVSGEVYRGYGGGDQVSLGQHTHNQGSDSHGDAEVPTNPPTAGT